MPIFILLSGAALPEVSTLLDTLTHKGLKSVRNHVFLVGHLQGIYSSDFDICISSQCGFLRGLCTSILRIKCDCCAYHVSYHHFAKNKFIPA